MGNTVCRFSLISGLLIRATFLFAEEGAVISGGVSPGGNHALSSTTLLDGVFGLLCDGQAAGTDTVLKGGYAGQWCEPVGVLASADEPNVAETTSCQLSAALTNDDGSLTVVRTLWAVLDGPIASVDSNGVALSSVVYQDSPALVAASSGGLTGMVSLMVLDTLKDNYGLYAGDNVADAWQVSLFGLNNTNGLASADPDRDGANNLSEFIAGTSPLNRADVFGIISICRHGGNQTEVVVAPAFSNRSYRIEGALSLKNPDWVPMGWHTGPTQTTLLAIFDASITNNAAFYRAAVDYAW